MSGFHHRSDLVGLFAYHPVAANLLMIMMLLSGAWALNRLNTQFFPTFDIEVATARVVWSGASAEDVEKSITTPLEKELRDVDFVKEMTSTSTDGLALISLEFEEGTDMGLAVDQMKERVELVRNLPASAEKPEVSRVVRYEPVARVLVTGSGDLAELRPLVYRFEQELLDRGIAKVFIRGLPEEEIAIQIPSRTLRGLGLSLDAIGRRVAAWSRDIPVGIVGRGETSRQIRFEERRETERGFEALPLVATGEGRLLTLGDVATVEQRPRNNQVSIRYNGQPAVELALNRTEGSDSLKAARAFHDWLQTTTPALPAGVELIPYAENWQLLKGRISLLLKNGLGGLVLVVLILFWFLNARVAWWVAVGIPTSFMAALAVLYLAGGSINMISLFGLIMTLGIIVDDAIVVGEDSMVHYQHGEDPLQAAESGARRMLGPVFSSSLTTISAFMPLMFIGGIMGAILKEIPLVVVCVLVASLVECFLVLPGHLQHAFRRMGDYRPGRFRRWLDDGFRHFREGLFRPLVRTAVNFRWTVVAIAWALLLVTAGLLAGGRVSFEFFPTAEADRLYANVDFSAGTPADKVETYLGRMERALYETEKELGEKFIRLVLVKHGTVESKDESGARRGDHFGAIRVELLEPDARSVRNREIVKAWRARLRKIPGIENLYIVEPRAGPPGRDLDLLIVGEDIGRAKQAAEALKAVMVEIPGVSGVEDDAPYGREQMVLSLTPTGEALGLTIDSVAAQLRAAYDGYLVQEFSDGNDDIEVRVMLPDAERDRLRSFSDLDIVLPDGGMVPVENIASVELRRGFEALRHADGRLAVKVVGDIDPALTNTNQIRAELERSILPQLAARH
ncbi:MAG: efflux RND transporter permease subunit, partial [Pseudomonadota bacterium]|nr:efflux RND transporter permease subunit [Pseudomonadota bacterium]